MSNHSRKSNCLAAGAAVLLVGAACEQSRQGIMSSAPLCSAVRRALRLGRRNRGELLEALGCTLFLICVCVLLAAANRGTTSVFEFLRITRLERTYESTWLKPSPITITTH